MGITQNMLRGGNFTSSEIVALTKFGTREMTAEEMDEYKKANPKGKRKNISTWPGQAALTYIEERNMERRLGRSLDNETEAKPTSWGLLMEQFVFARLGLEYTLSSQETVCHPEIDCWLGSADGIKHDEGRTVFDFKCPFTLKSFCQLVDPLYTKELHMTEVDGVWVYDGIKAINHIRENHKDGDKFYYQLVSNAIINNCKYAELIVFMPCESDLAEIKALAEGHPNLYWLNFAQDGTLPFLKDGGYYNSLNKIRFEVPQADKDFLTNCVNMAKPMLIPREPFLMLAEHDTEVNATIIKK